MGSYMNKLLSYFFIILILSSCSTKLTVIDYSVAPKNAKELIARVNSKNKTPEWLALKGKVNLIKDERDITLNINIKFRKDSVVWASVSAPFGIELFRTMLTPDSVYYINRTNKTYFKKPISYISSFLKTDISFQQVHEMITANPSILKNDYDIHYRDIYEIKSPNAGYFISDNYFRILYADLNEGENQLISMDGTTFNLSSENAVDLTEEIISLVSGMYFGKKEFNAFEELNKKPKP